MVKVSMLSREEKDWLRVCSMLFFMVYATEVDHYRHITSAAMISWRPTLSTISAH